MKLVLASNRLKLPLEEILPQINKIVDEIIRKYDFCKNGKYSITHGFITFVDFYTKERKEIYSTSYFSSVEDLRAIASYEPTYKTMAIYPDRVVDGVLAQSKDDPNFREEIIGNILHELSHATDPKLDVSKNLSFLNREKNEWAKTELRKNNMAPYMKSPHEIDAIMQQITYDAERYAKASKTNKKEVIDWLSRPIKITYKEDCPPFISKNNIIAIKYWTEHKPNALKMLRQRIYNAIR